MWAMSKVLGNDDKTSHTKSFPQQETQRTRKHFADPAGL